MSFVTKRICINVTLILKEEELELYIILMFRGFSWYAKMIDPSAAVYPKGKE